MKNYLDEDEIITLLNDVTITEDEISTIELNDMDKLKLKNNIIKTIKKKGSNKRRNFIAAAIAFICLTIIAGESTIAAINSKIFGENKAIEQAIENNYVQEINGDSAYDNGVTIQLKNILMDKATLALSFNLKFDNPEIIRDIKNMTMDFEIKNHNGRILKGYREHDLSDENVIRSISSGRDNFEILNNKTGEIRYNVILNSSDKSIEELKNIDINIKCIIYDKGGLTDIDEKPGEWSLKAEVDDKFKNDKSIAFNAENREDDIKVNSVETTPISTIVEFSVPKDKDLSYMYIYKNLSLIDDKGVRREIAGGVSGRDGKEDEHMYTADFPVSIFDNPKKLTFVLNDYNGRNVEINLNRNEN